MTKKKILIATGGTGGHIFPAYSLANYLDKKNIKVKITIDKRGFEYLKNYKNIKIIKLPASPFFKGNIFKVFFSILIITFSIIKSLNYLIFNRPSLVIGMGGYSSFPICIAAYILKIKFIIYENNLIIGKANKILLPFAKKILVSYKDLEGVPKKYNDKIVQVGNIVREEIINSNIVKENTNNFGVIKILVLGGSQAAQIFGELLPKVFEELKKNNLSIKIYQQCQKRQNEYLSNFYKNKGIDYEVFNFTDKIMNYYNKANLVITRAGASVLGELINVNIPFISIPLPTSKDNHQLKNAQFYEKKGYGYLMEEKDIKDKLYNLIISIFNDKSSLENILLKQKNYSDKDIFKNLDILIDKISNEKN